MKKFLAVLTAVMLVFAMASMAFAAGTNPKISKEATNTHTYDIFQMFTGSVEDGQLVNVKYGVNKPASATAGADVDSATLQAAIDSVKDTESKTYNDNEKEAAMSVFCDFTSTPYKQLTATVNEVEVVPGYYLIKDTTAVNGTDDAASINIIKVVDSDLQITPKTSKTTLDKVIVEDTANVKGVEKKQGDIIKFQVTVTLATEISDYDTYTLNIYDTLPDSLDYYTDSTHATTIKNGSTDVASKFTASTSTRALSWKCADIKSGDNAITGGTVVVTYFAKLNENFVSGSAGNENSAYCEFSNNPNNSSDLGKTPPSKAKVYNFKLTLNKVDENGDALIGASFKLSKLDSVSGNYELVEEIDGATISTFEFKGLTSGKYKIEESARPSGYNAIDDITFTLNEEIDDDGEITYDIVDDDDFFSVSATGDGSASIMNEKGSVLPTTGGIGTYIFTGLGAVLVLGAAIYFISKKKTEQQVG